MPQVLTEQALGDEGNRTSPILPQEPPLSPSVPGNDAGNDAPTAGGSDIQLKLILDRWPQLPADIKRIIVRLATDRRDDLIAQQQADLEAALEQAHAVDRIIRAMVQEPIDSKGGAL